MGRAFVEISVAAVGDPDAAAVSSTLVDVSLDLLAADAAGLTLGDSRPELRLAATSTPDAESIGLLELDVGEGPGLDCYRTAEPVVAADLLTDDRWPRFTAAAAGIATVRSVHALPEHRPGVVLRVLDLLDGTPGPLSRPDLALGQAFADTAA
ncbi:MAG: GAF domain-containing protein, partial [Pseudonocardia sediminis]